MRRRSLRTAESETAAMMVSTGAGKGGNALTSTNSRRSSTRITGSGSRRIIVRGGDDGGGGDDDDDDGYSSPDSRGHDTTFGDKPLPRLQGEPWRSAKPVALSPMKQASLQVAEVHHATPAAAASSSTHDGDPSMHSAQHIKRQLLREMSGKLQVQAEHADMVEAKQRLAHSKRLHAKAAKHAEGLAAQLEMILDRPDEDDGDGSGGGTDVDGSDGGTDVDGSASNNTNTNKKKRIKKQEHDTK